MFILGISAYYHDSACALIRNGEIVAAAHEERFTRAKHDPRFPHYALEYCLNEAGIKFNDLDRIVFYDKPFLKFERLLDISRVCSQRIQIILPLHAALVERQALPKKKSAPGTFIPRRER